MNANVSFPRDEVNALRKITEGALQQSKNVLYYR